MIGRYAPCQQYLPLFLPYPQSMSEFFKQNVQFLQSLQIRTMQILSVLFILISS